MNRIDLGPLAAAVEQPKRRSGRRPSSSGQGGLGSPAEHTLFVPLHYEPNYAYPLLVWLHDESEDGAELPRVMAALSLRNYVAVGPQAMAPSSSAWPQEWPAIEAADRRVSAACEEAFREYHIARGKVFLGGIGSGGTMAFRIAFQRPEYFAGVVSINGPLPQQPAALAALNRCRRVPVFWTHCCYSQEFGEATVAAQLRLLHVAGFDVTLRQYPTREPHYDLVFPDVNRWLMELVTRAPHRPPDRRPPVAGDALRGEVSLAHASG